MNFQTAVCDLTGMPLANCSLLDEATAAAEAVTMMYALRPRDMQKSGANVVFVDEAVFPQTLAVMTTRAIPQGIELRIGKYHEMEFTPDIFACVLQYPNAAGNVEDYRAFVEKAHAANCKVAVAADILSLALLTPPGEWGADIVFGTTQRLGTPMFYGGPSAAYFATRDEYKRNMPGRIIGWSKDKYGKLCYRMALQTREQHIKREKATSNICTAQALLARWLASMPYITVRKASAPLQNASTALPYFWKKVSTNWGTSRSMHNISTRSALHCPTPFRHSRYVPSP